MFRITIKNRGMSCYTFWCKFKIRMISHFVRFTFRVMNIFLLTAGTHSLCESKSDKMWKHSDLVLHYTHRNPKAMA